MSGQIPPPPPPPPHPIMINSEQKVGGNQLLRINRKRDHPLPLCDRFVYTHVEEPALSPQEDVKRICRILNERISAPDVEATPVVDSTVWLAHYKQVKSVLQDGPKCGLVAIAAIAPMLKTVVKIEEVFELAKVRGFTIQGEMFSAGNLCRLLEELCPCRCELVHLSENYSQSRATFLSHLAKGYPILVPYDADRNHEPICRNGHLAHWAAITGMLIRVQKPSNSTLSSYYDQDERMAGVFHAKSEKEAYGQLQELRGDADYILAKHGKSRHTAYWSLPSVLKSNANLFEIGPERLDEIDQYVVPDGGVEAGLCKQIVLVHPNSLQ